MAHGFRLALVAGCALLSAACDATPAPDRAQVVAESATLAPRFPPARPIITTSGQHTCALRQGTVYCWGANQFGQLGNGTNTGSSTPVAVPLATFVVDLSAGDFSTCAVDVYGRVFCWGVNSSGQLGTGNFGSSSLPVRPIGLPPIAHVAADTDTTCAIATNGTVWCWGDDSIGSVGNGTTGINQPTPVQVTGLANAVADAVWISAGDEDSCASTLLGAFCWGNDVAGQIGNGTTSNSFVTRPAAVIGLP
jgi:hypothetical protein